jgi:hypothetical protein
MKDEKTLCQLREGACFLLNDVFVAVIGNEERKDGLI